MILYCTGIVLIGTKARSPNISVGERKSASQNCSSGDLTVGAAESGIFRLPACISHAENLLSPAAARPPAAGLASPDAASPAAASR
jgi:hypothetical protein